MAWHMTQRHARGHACVKRGRSSTQFVRDDGFPNVLSEKKRSHSCETNSQRQPHRWRTIRSAWQHCTALVQRRQLAGDRIVVVEVRPTRWRSQRVGVVQGPPRRFGHRPEPLSISTMDSNAQPRKALARNSVSGLGEGGGGVFAFSDDNGYIHTLYLV